MNLSLCAEVTCDKRCRDWQLGRCQTERFTCQLFADAVHFVQYFTRLDLGNPVLRVTFTVTHPDLSRFLRDRLVWENTDPDTTATFNVTGHGTTGCLNLASRQTATTSCFQTEVAKVNIGTASSQA